MYQIVAIRLLDFYLVEDVDSRDAENEGLSLVLQFKWLPQGIFWLVDAVKRPHKVTHFLWNLFSFPQFFEVKGWERCILDLLLKVNM